MLELVGKFFKDRRIALERKRVGPILRYTVQGIRGSMTFTRCPSCGNDTFKCLKGQNSITCTHCNISYGGGSKISAVKNEYSGIDLILTKPLGRGVTECMMVMDA